MSRIGGIIAQARKTRNMSQMQLAKKLDVTKQTVSNYETGTRTPDLEMLERIADALGLTFGELVHGELTPTQPEDDEIRQMREDMRRNPDLRGLWSIQRKATKEQLQRMRDFAEGVTGNGKIDETDTP